MKVFLAITCFVFCALGVSSHGIRAKRGLSADEQKKLIDVLTKDRQEFGNKTDKYMFPIKYDMDLEKKADSKPCPESDDNTNVPLQYNSVIQEILKLEKKRGFSASAHFYWPTATKIGCSKSYKCSSPLTEREVMIFGQEFHGKTKTVHGTCFFDIDPSVGYDKSDLIAIIKAEVPHPSKYGDLLGVPKPIEEIEVGTSATATSSGNVSAVANGASLNFFFFLIPLFVVFTI